MKKISFDDLSGKVCVITGGAGVIGVSIVKALASVGTKVAIEETSEGIKINASDGVCLVEKDYKHSTPNHSCIFYNFSSKSMIAQCFSHKTKKITGETYKKINKWWVVFKIFILYLIKLEIWL